MVKYQSNFFLLSLISIFIINISSCNFVKPFFIKNKKKEVRKEKRVEKKDERKEAKNKNNSEKIEVEKKEMLNLASLDTIFARKLIQLRTNDYNTFQSKAKMKFEAGSQKQNFNANFRLKKNEIIWVSISAFGIEVARALITPDSVKAFERINKKYFLYSYKNIQELINLEVEFKTLQDLIVGNAISTMGKITDIQDLNGISTILIKGLDFNNQLSFTKSDSTLKQIQLQTMRTVSSSSLHIAFSDYKKENNYLLSQNRVYNVQDVKGTANLEMELNKFEFNKIVDYPFTIPSNYSISK